MPLPENIDPLDALLRENDAHIEDGGFTARVVASLPPRRKSRFRAMVLSGTVLLGMALLLWLLPSISTSFTLHGNTGILRYVNQQMIFTLFALLLSGASLGWTIIEALRAKE